MDRVVFSLRDSHAMTAPKLQVIQDSVGTHGFLHFLGLITCYFTHILGGGKKTAFIHGFLALQGFENTLLDVFPP